MAKNNDLGPDGLPVDKSPATFGQSDADASAATNAELMRIAEEQDENTTFENETNPEEPTQVKVAAGTNVNPSSTYPGRNKELAENDMRIPTPLDVAKRAANAGSQWPAMASAAGLSREDFAETSGEANADEQAADQNA